MAARHAIGLDIGTSGVRAAELSFGRHGVTLEKFGQVAVPPGAVRDGEVVDADAVAVAIRQLWAATKFSTKEVVLGVANQRVVVRTVEVAWLPPAELRTSLPLQVADLLPMPVSDAVLDFHPLEEVHGPRGRMLRGLLVAAVRESVLGNVRCVEQAGLKPMSVDLTSFAVLRSLGTSGLHEDARTEVLVDVGARVTNIVVHTAGVPHFVRILLMGGHDLTDALSERLGVSLGEAEGLKQTVGLDGGPGAEPNAVRTIDACAQTLVDEIRGSLDYFRSSFAGVPPERVVLSGGGSTLRGFAARLEQGVRIPVVMGDPMRTMRLGRTGLDDDQLALVQPLAAVPVGLAMGGAR